MESLESISAKRATTDEVRAILASQLPKRVPGGTVHVVQPGETLTQISARYGVQKEVLAAIWGMESSFGARRGNVPVISARSSGEYGLRIWPEIPACWTGRSTIVLFVTLR